MFPNTSSKHLMQIDIPDGVSIHVCKQFPFDIKTFKATGGIYTINYSKPTTPGGLHHWYVRRFPTERTKMVNGEAVTYDMWFVDVKDIPTPPRKLNSI